MRSPTRSPPIAFGVGRKNKQDDAPTDHPLFESAPGRLLAPSSIAGALKQKARASSGPWVRATTTSTCSPTRRASCGWAFTSAVAGFGHTIASGFLALSQNKPWGERVKESEVLLDLAEPLGHDYWHLMNLAGEYAYAGRE